MADIDRFHPAPPRDWAEAFAALPLEGPAVAAWPAITARIDARRRPRWPVWLATAAALALVAVVPLQRYSDDAAPRAAQGAGDAAGSGRDATAAGPDTNGGATPPESSGMRGHPDSRPLPETTGARLARVSPATPQPSQAQSPLMAATLRSDAATREEFERLFAESAQLEAVLDLARDDRVASGPAAVLAGELEAYVASIDTALSQPALPPAQRLALWDERVDAMRQVVGFASTQRLLAANGDRFDGALVSVD